MSHQIKGNGHEVLQKHAAGPHSWPRKGKVRGPRTWQGTMDALCAKSKLKLSRVVGRVSHNAGLLRVS